MDKFKLQVEQKTDQELVDIYLKPHDYQPDLILVVEQELTKRKIPLESIKYIKSKTDEVDDNKLELGEQGNTLWIALCFFAAIFGGVISIVAGYIYAYSKRKNSQGVDTYVYNEQTRKYGKWMLIIGASVFIISILFELGNG